jgi:copper(I)-binding protein
MRIRAAALAAAMVMTGACDGDAEPPLIGISEAGVDGVVGSLRILAVHVVAPHGDRYPRGTDLRVVLTIVNVGGAPDALVGAESANARRVDIRWDRNCDGKPEVMPRLPIAPADQPTSPQGTVGAGPFDPYDLLLVSIREDVLAGTTVPLTLSFERAGRLVTAAYVQPESAHIVEPVRRCSPSTSHTPAPKR